MLTRSAPVHSTLDDANANGGARDARVARPHVAETRDLRSVWTSLRWRASLIAAMTVAAVVIAAVATVVVPPKYKATTIVLVDPRQPHVTNSAEVMGGIGSDAAAVESQVELIESSSLAKKVIGRLNLDQDPEFASPSLLDDIRDGVMSLFGRTPDNQADRQTSRLVSRFQRGLQVKRRGLTYILEISYLSIDPAKAARISSALADGYLEDQRQAKTDITARASDWLGDRIQELRERLRVSEQAVAAYKSANNIVDVTQGNRLINRQIEDLTQQLALARSRTADARARLERVQQAAKRVNDPAALSESLQSQVIANLRSQYTEAARVEAEYSALYGSRYPGLLAVRAQLADIRRQIESELSRIVTAIRSENQVATARESALEAELTKLKQQSASLNAANVKLQELDREAQSNRLLYEQFLNRVKETTEQQSLQLPDARIVSPALIPLQPDRPPRSLLLLVAAAFGMLLSIGIVLVQEQTRRGLRTAGDVEQALSRPLLGFLPRRTHRDATIEHSLRTIRTRLRRLDGRTDGEILVVTSALQDEGKSTFARNFALTAAAAGTKTLLIDGDVRIGSVTRTFGISGPGLRDVVQGKVPLLQAMKKEPKSGMCVLGVGASADPAGGGEIGGPELESLLRSCREQFDLIVVDTPAILAMAGLAPFMAAADRAVLIVEWDRTDRQVVTEALDMLGPEAGKIAGVVLNKVETKWHRLFKSGGYYYDRPMPAQGAARTQA